jgi:hypothetical protein
MTFQQIIFQIRLRLEMMKKENKFDKVCVCINFDNSTSINLFQCFGFVQYKEQQVN